MMMLPISNFLTTGSPRPVKIILACLALLAILGTLTAILTRKAGHTGRRNAVIHMMKHQNISERIRTGDVICRVGNSIWSCLFSSMSERDSRFCHVGLIINMAGHTTVIHAEANDFTGIGFVFEQPLEDFLLEGGGAAIYRLKDSVAQPMPDEVTTACILRNYLGTPFDYQFDLNTRDSLYCSELVWLALKKLAPTVELKKNTRNNKTFIPVDSCNDPRFFNEIVTLNDIGKLGKPPSR